MRARLATKRKAKEVLHKHQWVLVRDATDDRYPILEETKPEGERGRWRVRKVLQCQHDGVALAIGRHFAFLDDDGEHWDYAETMNDALSAGHVDPWERERTKDKVDRAVREAAMQVWDSFPEQNRGWLDRFVILPYDNIIAIDAEGDEIFRQPHVYAAPWLPADGPFTSSRWAALTPVGEYARWPGRPVPELRVEKFPRLPKKGE